MPDVHGMELPKPKNWQDFERITLAAQKQSWGSPDLQMNGRPGQAQQGVDIWGPDSIGRRVGVQCKRYKDALSLKLVEEEIANAENFQPTLSALYIATTNDYDSKLQQEVRLLSDKRVANGDFAVSMLFWDDITAGLTINPDVFQGFFPGFHLPTHTPFDRGRMLAAFELGFYGPFINEYVHLTFGEIGVYMANTDPETVAVVLRIIERRASQLLPEADARHILDAVAEISSRCYEGTPTKQSWDEVEFFAKRIETRLNHASSVLDEREGSMLETGIVLGRSEHADEVTQTRRDDIRGRLRSLLPQASQPAIDAAFERAEPRRNAGYRWATIIRGIAEREIRFSL